MKQLSMYDTLPVENTLAKESIAAESPVLTLAGPPAYQEPSAYREPSAYKELSADIEPSAFREPLAIKKPLPFRPSKTNQLTDGSDKATDAYSPNVTEIIIAKQKADNIQMLLPMLNNLSQEKRWLAWIDPPIQLLRQWQESHSELATEEIMILRSSDTNSAFQLSKKALEAGTCHAVIAWTNPLSSEEFSALEEASAKGNSHGIILRSR